MADHALTELLRRAPFSFLGTVEHLGAATMGDVPIDDRTAVVRVEQLLHSPEAFAGLGGQRITVQLAPDVDPLPVGSTAALFAEGLAFGESVAVTETGRLSVEEVAPFLTSAAEPGEPGPFAALQREIERDRLRERMDAAVAVVVGQVVSLEKALPGSYSEHDPDWWCATLSVSHVERGDVEPGEVQVLYANSLDVQWRKAPKPRAAQTGLWILHATEGELAEAAPFQILDAEDHQPAVSLDWLRGAGG